MELYRKYFTEDQLHAFGVTQLNWGVNVLTIGHYLHAASTTYPDSKHPQSYIFSWDSGRILSEYQILYIAKGKGVLEIRDAAPIIIEEGIFFCFFRTFGIAINHCTIQVGKNFGWVLTEVMSII